MKKGIFACLACLAFYSAAFSGQLHQEDFDALMGKGSVSLKSLKHEPEALFLRQCKDLYERNITLKDDKEERARIPKVIHFIWLGPKALPKTSKENIRTWVAKNPGWKFVLWTDRERKVPFKEVEVKNIGDFSFTKLKDRYQASDKWGEKADILCYEILFQEGGLYVYHDAKCLQSFEELNCAYDMYCGLAAPYAGVAGLHLTCSNGVIGAKPHHPTVARVMDIINNRWDRLETELLKKKNKAKNEVFIQRTYLALTDAVKESMQESLDRDIILPTGYFFATEGIASVYSKSHISHAYTDSDYVDQDFERLVSSSFHRWKTKDKHALGHFFAVCALALIAVVMLFAVILKIKQRYFS